MMLVIRFDERRGEISDSKSSTPFLVTVRLLKRCTAKCLMCDFWKDKSSGMSFSNLKKIINQCKKNNVKEICFTGGEPTSYEHFFDAVNYLKLKGLDYSFITNGSLLSKTFVEKLMHFPPRRIYLSIDSPKSEFHDAVRGFPGLLRRIFLGLKELNKYKNRPKIIINCVISNENYKDVPDLIKLSERKYFDEINLMQIKGMPKWNLSFDQILDYNQNIVPLINENLQKYNVLLRFGSPYIFGLGGQELDDSTKGVYSREYYKKNKCSILGSMLFIETNGDVFPCNNTPYYGDAFKCGNIFENDLAEILVSKKMNMVRTKMCGSALCTGCDPINRAINAQVPKMSEISILRSDLK